jgi:hypothetical protein
MFSRARPRCATSNVLISKKAISPSLKISIKKIDVSVNYQLTKILTTSKMHVKRLNVN